MTSKSFSSKLTRQAGKLALKAAQLLEEELDGNGDTKRARELSAILKEMSALARDGGDAANAELRVRFLGEAGEAGE